MIFNINDYVYDTDHNCLEIGGEAMVFHCHHYINYLQRSILDAYYIDSRPFLIGSAADAVYHQLNALCKGLSIDASKKMAEEIYKTFGHGLIDLSAMSEEGVKVETNSSFFSKTWHMKYQISDKPVDYYTTGFVAAAYAVIYQKPLHKISAHQTTCMACGDALNTYIVHEGEGNFKTYPQKQATQFNPTPKISLNWEHEDKITHTFLNAHRMMVGNEEGLIPAFGVYLVRNQSDYINRLQFEFIKAMRETAGEYGEALGSSLLLEAGRACGFYTYSGIMTSNEWKEAVQPYLNTKEDWIKALAALVNTMGWGYHTAVELTEEKAVFRNYNNFEDLSFMRMYGKSAYPVNWANSGGFTGLMQLIYQTNITEGEQIDIDASFQTLRRPKDGYKTNMTKSIACEDSYLEVEVYI